MKYKIIYADPPWEFSAWNKDKATHHVSKQYNTMDLKEICNLKVKDITDKNAVLFLWITFPNLQISFNVIKAWGFEYKTCGFNWIKTNKRFNMKQRSFLPIDLIDTFLGMGYYTRSNSELCLLATKGKPLKRISNSINQLIFAPMRGHSKKPNEVRNKIVELFGDIPRIELFAREKTEGWDVWGNEVDSDIDL